MAAPILTGPGFIVEDLGESTKGLVTPTTAFEVGDPLPPGAGFGADLLGRFYGVDLRYRIDYLERGDGDLQRTVGLEALKASFARALVTRPGEIFWRPNYGIGATDFLNLRATAGNIVELKNRIRTTLTSDPAVEEVSRLDVFVAASGLVEVFVDIRIAGQTQPIALGIREA